MFINSFKLHKQINIVYRLSDDNSKVHIKENIELIVVKYLVEK